MHIVVRERAKELERYSIRPSLRRRSVASNWRRMMIWGDGQTPIKQNMRCTQTITILPDATANRDSVDHKNNHPLQRTVFLYYYSQRMKWIRRKVGFYLNSISTVVVVIDVVVVATEICCKSWLPFDAPPRALCVALFDPTQTKLKVGGLVKNGKRKTKKNPSNAIRAAPCHPFAVRVRCGIQATANGQRVVTCSTHK